jgi:hypothetical protein
MAIATQLPPSALNGIGSPVVPSGQGETRHKLNFKEKTINLMNDNNNKIGTGSGGQVNGGLSSIPSPTMPNFGLAPGSANGQNGPAGQDPASVYNGLAQAYPSREFLPLEENAAEPGHE